MSHSRRGSALRLILGLTVCILLVTRAHAATPPSGAISEASPTVTWTGAIKPATAGGCGSANNATCDNFALTLALPSAAFGPYVVEIRLTPAADWDMEIYGPTGAFVTSSGNGPNTPEFVALINPAGGTYTVASAPFAPAVFPDGTSYTATARLRKKPISATSVGTENISYAEFPCTGNATKCNTMGEPSIGVNWKSGAVMFAGGGSLRTWRVTGFDDQATPPSATWTDVGLNQKIATSPRAYADPILFTDSRTGRTFAGQLEGLTPFCTTEYTDDDGLTWIPSQGSGIAAGIDHETYGGGPLAPPLTRDPALPRPAYPNGLYYCAQDLGPALCAISLDGGQTFGPSVAMWTTECNGIHGHVKVSPYDGTTYVPNKNCGGESGFAVSSDNGMTWTIRTVPGSLPANGFNDPSIGIATDGTVYFGFTDADGHPKIGVSHDKGVTWDTQPNGARFVDVGIPFGIENSVFPAVVAGDPDRAAFAFHGTTTPGALQDASFTGVWHLYVAQTYNGGKTWTTTRATSDPTQRGCIWLSGGSNSCRNILDFMDATIDPEGRVLVGFADGCRSCTTVATSRSAYGTIARQSVGKRMFAAFDPPESECVFPGRTILTDAGGDNTDVLAERDAISLSVNELGDIGANLMFVLKVGSLGVVPPSSTYAVVFKDGATDRWVRMQTLDPGFTNFVIFSHGTGTTPITTAATAVADYRSYYSTDGTIRIIVPKSAVATTGTLSNFRVQISADASANGLAPASGQVVDNMPNTGTAGTYTVSGGCTAVESPCSTAGVTIIADNENDSNNRIGEFDIRAVSVAEPSSLGSGKIMFILKMQTLSDPPPNSTWPVLFSVRNVAAGTNADFFVRMQSDANGAISFSYGSGTNVAVVGTPADPASSFSADGTIRVVVPRSGIGNPGPGDILNQFVTRVRIEASAAGALTPDNMPDDLSRRPANPGGYVIRGSEKCVVITASRFAISAPATATAGVPFSITVTAQDATGNTATTYAGTVHFTSSDAGATLPPDATLTNGVGTFTATLRTSGNQTVTATDTANASITGTANVLVPAVQAPTTTTLTAPSSSTYGQSVTLTATLSSSTAGTITGTVTFKDGATTLGTAPVNASGQAIFNTSALAGGTHSLSAEYGGDTNYGSSTSAPVSITVNPASSTTSLTSSPNPSTTAQSVTFTATVNGSGATPTGSVTFNDGAATLGSSSLNASGQASFSSAPLSAGTHAITATYGGSANYLTSVSGPISQVVTAVPPPAGAQFNTFTSPAGMGDSFGEPTIGINWLSENNKNGGTILAYGGLNNYMLRVGFDDSTSPASPKWEKSVTLPFLITNRLAGGDPILFTDKGTGRTFVSQLQFGTTYADGVYTDDDGRTFNLSQGSGITSGIDHQTIGGGPYHFPLPPGAVYKNAFYYCAQHVAEANCALSLDGGRTFGPSLPIFTRADCNGLHGHIKVAPDGTAYIPDKGCGGTDVTFHSDGRQAVVVSENNGLTWSVRPVPTSSVVFQSLTAASSQAWDPSVATATDGTLYFGYQAGNGHPRIAVSKDRGLTWINDSDVGALVSPAVVHTSFPAVVAGDPDRAAFAFFGTSTAGAYDTAGFPGVWYLYVATTYDGGRTWTTQNVTPNDPVQRGGICGSGTCRNLLDFFDASIDKRGRVVVGYEDGCVGSCVAGGANSFTAKFAIARQSGGPRMYAAFDPPAGVNRPPVAQNDTVSTAVNIPVSINVVGNDSDADGDSLLVAAVTQPANGTATSIGNGMITYTPASGFTGTNTFTYVASDERGGSATATVTVTVTAAPATRPVVFGHDTMADFSANGGEPFIRVATPQSTGTATGTALKDNIFVTAPFGFSTTISLLWRSIDGGKSFIPLGTPIVRDAVVGPGGGDSHLDFDAMGRIYYVDLSAGCVTAAVSDDGGNTFPPERNNALACIGGGEDPTGAGDDRQWVAAAGDGLAWATVWNLASVGNNYHLFWTRDAGRTWHGRNFGSINATGGPIMVDKTKRNGKYLIYQLYNRNPISIFRITDNDDGTAPTTASRSVASASVVLFSVLGIDTAGNLYVAYSNGTHVFLTTSQNQGDTWTTPINITSPLGATGFINIEPWIVAGDPGRIDIIWYRTAGANNSTAAWDVQMAQSLNALSGSPTFTYNKVNQTTVHRGEICTGGLGCDVDTLLGNPRDRSFLEYPSIDIDSQGLAVITFNHNTNQAAGRPEPGGAYVMVNRQKVGPSLYASVGSVALDTGAVSITQPVENQVLPSGASVAVTGAHALPAGNSTIDTTGDAKFPDHGPLIGGNIMALDLRNVSLTNDATGITVTMTVGDATLAAMTAAAPQAGGDGVLYLTQWALNDPGNPNNENVYWVAAEVRAGVVQFLTGTLGVIRSATSKKYITYNPDLLLSQQLTGSFSSTAPGTITVRIPRSIAGNPGSTAKLFMISGYTMSERGPLVPTGDLGGGRPNPSSLPVQVDAAAPFAYAIGSVADGKVEISVDNPDFISAVAATAAGNGSWSATLTGVTAGAHTLYARQQINGREPSAAAMVHFRVNAAPVAVADSASTRSGVPVTVNVLTNDSDPDGDALTVTAVTQGGNGSVINNGGGLVTYTSNAGFVGTDSFTYTVSDPFGAAATGTVTITVTAANRAPVASNDSYTTAEDAPLAVAAPGVLGNDTDADGDALTASLVAGPAHGLLSLATNGSFSYTPAANYNGADSFTYKANDGKENSNVATVSITITAVNDAPTAANDAYSTAEDTPLNIGAPGVLGNDTDADGDALKAVLASAPAHGTLTLNADGSFSYTPAANYNGADSFTYKANDGTVDSNAATVSITITAVNDAPVAGNDSYTTAEDTPLNVGAPGVLGNDIDVDGDALQTVLANAPAHGTLTLNANGSFSYTPAANYNGADSFTYKANDGTVDSNVATVSITITAVNDAPVATNDAYSVKPSGTLSVSTPGVLVNDGDVDSTALKAILASTTSNGALTLNSDGSFVYTPSPGFKGTDSFTYKANDGQADSNVATATITVTTEAARAVALTGAGEVVVTNPDGTGSFGFTVKRDTADGSPSGQLSFFNNATGLNVVSVAITSLNVAGTSASFAGTCTRNGSPCTFSVSVEDNGEPGKNVDRFSIAVSGDPVQGGAAPITAGNVQIH